MNVVQVRKCSEQLKKLLHEQHNALDASITRQIQEVIEALDACAKEEGESSRLLALLSILNLLRSATNIAELISRINRD